MRRDSGLDHIKFNYRIMFKKILLPGLCCLLLLGLSGCYIPIVDKEVTVPFLERKPEQAVKLMYAQMGSVSTMKYNGDVKMNVHLDPEKLNLEDLTQNSFPAFSSKNNSSPRVLGVNNMESSQANTGNSLQSGASNPMGGIGKGLLKSLQDIKVDYKLSGKLDRTDPENIKTFSDIDMGVKLGNTSYEAQMKTKSLGEKSYFNIQGVPMPLSMFLGGMMDKWISVNPEKIAEEQGGGSDSLWNDQEKIEKVRQQVMELAAKHNPIRVTERLKDKEVDGQECYHYKVAVNKDNLQTIILKTLDILHQEFEGDKKELSEAKKKIKEMTPKIEKAVTDFQAEIWIDQEDFYLRKSEFSTDIDPTLASEKIPEKSIQLTISGQEKVYDFEQKVNITEPEDATPLSDLIESSFQAFSSGQTSSSESPDIATTSEESKESPSSEQGLKQIKKKDSDNDGLPDEAEINTFQTDPHNKDTDGDGYSDGKEVKEGYDPAGEGKLDMSEIKDQ